MENKITNHHLWTYGVLLTLSAVSPVTVTVQNWSSANFVLPSPQTPSIHDRSGSKIDIDPSHRCHDQSRLQHLYFFLHPPKQHAPVSRHFMSHVELGTSIISRLVLEGKAASFWTHKCRGSGFHCWDATFAVKKSVLSGQKSFKNYGFHAMWTFAFSIAWSNKYLGIWTIIFWEKKGIFPTLSTVASNATAAKMKENQNCVTWTVCSRILNINLPICVWTTFLLHCLHRCNSSSFQLKRSSPASEPVNGSDEESRSWNMFQTVPNRKRCELHCSDVTALWLKALVEKKHIIHFFGF